MSVEDTKALAQRADVALKKLSSVVLEGRKPPSGAYVFFNNSSHALTALHDCRRIFQRLDDGRSKLTELAHQERSLKSDDWPAGVPYPPDVQAVMREENDLTELMKLDLESLYIFGGILLDQWGLQAIAIGSLPCKRDYPFRELVDLLDRKPSGSLKELWTTVAGDALWLYYQLRFYRNRFIMHVNRPWQRGTTRSVFGDDFNLFVPTPPGWLDDEALEKEIRSLIHLAPDYIQKAPEDYWEKARTGHLIEVLFDNIDKYAKADREKVSSVFGRKGGSTPNFRILANKLFWFRCNCYRDASTDRGGQPPID